MYYYQKQYLFKQFRNEEKENYVRNNLSKQHHPISTLM